jgi:carbamoylphosphate synthase small subunit
MSDAMTRAALGAASARLTACLALADGTVFMGRGFGATGIAEGELCFNTAMTGYQEIMTDPSYAGQIVTFTFPHIGNVGSHLTTMLRPCLHGWPNAAASPSVASTPAA